MSMLSSQIATAALLLSTTAMVAQGASHAAASENAAKLHPLEAYCIEYRVEGARTGRSTECIRGHGAERVEIHALSPAGVGDALIRTEVNAAQAEVSPAATPVLHRVIYRKDEIIAMDLTAGRGARVPNPESNALAAFMSGKTGEEIAEAFAAALDGESDGEQQEIAGQTCTVWGTSQPGYEASWCISDQGLLLSFTVVSSVTKTAERVTIGDGGPAENYGIPAGMKIVDSRDPSMIGAILGEVQ